MNETTNNGASGTMAAMGNGTAATDANISMQPEPTLDNAALASQIISEAAQLSSSPEAMANALASAMHRISELESIVAAIRNPDPASVEEAMNAGTDLVHAIPASWIDRMNALAAHAEAALGFRHPG